MQRHRWVLPLLFLALTMCAPASTQQPAPSSQPPAQAAPGMRRVGGAPAQVPAAPATPAAQVEAQPVAELSPDLQKRWQSRITPRVKREPWRNTGRYDAASLLMLPMHAAFEHGYVQGQEEFADHVTRFLGYRDSVNLGGQDVLNWIQYFYFLSRYTVVAAQNDRASLIPEALPGALHGWVGDLWLRVPAWQWYRQPFKGGIRERIDWKLSGAKTLKGRSFEKAILDQELLLFAVAADLRTYGRRVGSKLANDPMLEEIDRYARRVYANRVGWTRDSGWTFQPGLLRDHPDHRYQCRFEKRIGLEPCSTATGVDDASHAHRYPLMLRSMAESQPEGSQGRAFYNRLLRGLERQFFTRIAAPPSDSFPGWRIRNYMDGENGMYRWQYATIGPNNGYGPYQVSGALLQGWWTFLPGRRATELYQNIVKQFPLTEQQLAVYGGPTYKPGKGGLLSDGTVELICRLAAVARRPVLGGE